MRRFFLTAAVAATALAGTACGDSTGLGSGIAGTYELRTVNGLSLPVSNASNTVLAGELEIESNGEFRETIQYQGFTDTRFGTWERDGDEILFEYDDNFEQRLGERTSSSRILIRDEDTNDWLYVRS